MGDRSGNLSRVRMSEDKMRRKDLCGSVRVVYVLEKLSDISGPGLVEVRHYRAGIRARFNIKHVICVFKTKDFVCKNQF